MIARYQESHSHAAYSARLVKDDAACQSRSRDDAPQRATVAPKRVACPGGRGSSRSTPDASITLGDGGGQGERSPSRRSVLCRHVIGCLLSQYILMNLGLTNKTSELSRNRSAPRSPAGTAAPGRGTQPCPSSPFLNALLGVAALPD